MTNLIRVSKIAKHLGVTRQRVYQLIEKGEIQAMEIDGVKFVDIDRLKPDLIKRHHEKIMKPSK